MSQCHDKPLQSAKSIIDIVLHQNECLGHVHFLSAVGCTVTCCHWCCTSPLSHACSWQAWCSSCWMPTHAAHWCCTSPSCSPSRTAQHLMLMAASSAAQYGQVRHNLAVNSLCTVVLFCHQCNDSGALLLYETSYPRTWFTTPCSWVQLAPLQC